MRKAGLKLSCLTARNRGHLREKERKGLQLPSKLKVSGAKLHWQVEQINVLPKCEEEERTENWFWASTVEAEAKDPGWNGQFRISHCCQK